MKHWASKMRCAAIISFALVAFPAVAAFVQLISKPDSSFAPSASGGSDSGLPIISADGRYVLFASTANNLALMSTSNPAPPSFPATINVLLRDRASNTTTLVSVNLTGVGSGNGDSFPAGISTNGQFALFESAASNLIAGDTNNASDVFVRDLASGATFLASISTGGSAGNGASRNSVMTPDGRYVAFVSVATNLVVGDTNKIPDVFVRDLQSALTTLVSAGAISTNAATLTSSSEAPVITPDGRYVAFYSSATNLVPAVRTASEIYVRDLAAGTTAWVSTNARAIFQSITGKTNAISYSPRISDDGRYVAFETSTNVSSYTLSAGLVLRHDLQTGLTDLIRTNANVPLLSYENIRSLDMSPDGRFVTFLAEPGIALPAGPTLLVYLWDALAGTKTLVSTTTNGWIPAINICASPVVSSNGQFVAFLSSGDALATNAADGAFHLYLRDLQSGTTQLVDADTNGTGVGVNSTTVPSLSADGRFVAFESSGRSLVANDRNSASDVFARDTATDTTELISARHPALPSVAPNGVSGAFLYSVSANGRFVAFASEADDLVTNDTNGLRDVFVRDLLIGSNILVSVGTNGFAGAGMSTEPSISGDGRYVAFSSFATNLKANDSNNKEDVFIRDLMTGTTTLVSVSTDGVAPGNMDSYLPTLGADGRYVLFRSKASNLAAGSFGNSVENLFLCDLQLGTTYPLTMSGLTSVSATPDGRFIAFVDPAASSAGKVYVWNTQLAARSTNTSALGITTVAISPDGSKLATFGGSGVLGLRVTDRLSGSNVLVALGNPSARPGLQFSGDGRFLVYVIIPTGQTYQIRVFDWLSTSNLLVSRRFDSPSAASGVSDSAAISADGRFVIFRSAATNIVANDTNDMPDLFVFDQTTGTNTLLSQSLFGSWPADNRSRTPVFSSNGRAVVFQSWASDLSAGDFNQLGDLFAFEFLYADIIPASSPPGGNILSWPAAPGETYLVQYKDNVDDSDWQDVPGTIIVTGNRAYLTNAPPIPDQRFYRVVAE